MKLPAKYRSLLFATVMAALMSIVMSFALTAFNVGLGNGFLSIWLRACGMAFVVEAGLFGQRKDAFVPNVGIAG